MSSEAGAGDGRDRPTRRDRKTVLQYLKRGGKAAQIRTEGVASTADRPVRLSIVSGTVESGYKNMVAKRLKQTGMMWTLSAARVCFNLEPH